MSEQEQEHGAGGATGASGGAGRLTLRPMLDAIGRGEVFRRVVSLIVQVLALLMLIGGVIALVRLNWEVLSNDPPFKMGLAVLLLLVFGLIALVAMAQVMWLRGNDIRKMESAQFTVMPIAAMLIRLYGEVTLVLSVVTGFLGMLLIWLGGERLAFGMFELWIPAWFDNAFFQGLAALVATAVWGFAQLVVAYLIAEVLQVFFSIAINTEQLARAQGERPGDEAL